MNKFAISPEDCLILKAFKDSSSLRAAAQLLQCDPAGLARRVQYISSTHGFLQKVNNRWQVTSQGLNLVAWTEASIESQRKILSEKTTLRIATTMWFSEELLIPNLTALKKQLSEKTNFSLTVPSKSFEMSLIDGSVDFVIVCHPPETPEIEHKQIASEEWVAVAPTHWKKEIQKSRNIWNELKKRPFIRHLDMNEDLFLPDSENLNYAGINIDNLIGIRTAVINKLGWSIVPRILVASAIKNDLLIELPVDLNVKDRKICVWWLRNRFEHRTLSNKICYWVKEVCI